MREKSFSIPLGGGEQFVKWLGHVAAQKYCESEGMCGDGLRESSCRTDELKGGKDQSNKG